MLFQYGSGKFNDKVNGEIFSEHFIAYDLRNVWKDLFLTICSLFIHLLSSVKTKPLKLKFIHKFSLFVNVIFFVYQNRNKLKPEFPILRNCGYSQRWAPQMATASAFFFCMSFTVKWRWYTDFSHLSKREWKFFCNMSFF